MRRLAAAVAVVVLATSCASWALEDEPTPPPGGVVIHIEASTLAVEVAATPADRARGLMHRTDLDPDAGMLFLFRERSSGGFWMKNTSIPLSIAFVTRLEEDYRIVDVLEMEPCTADPCPVYWPREPYDLAIEANRGWFSHHDLAPGMAVRFRVDGRLSEPS